ncbi:MAG: ergothioneine biosynthesis protein EgtB [Terriglobales bacterium]
MQRDQRMRSSGAAVARPIPGISEELVQHYQTVRQTTESICAPLTADDQMVQSTPEASPAKWHQAHTTWFFETFILTPHLRGYRPFDPQYRYLFNSYYKQLGAHPLRTTRAFFSRPTLDEVRKYRCHVDDNMLRLLEGDVTEIAPLITLGLNHEQQHQELILTDIKHAFASQPLQPAYVTRPVEHPSSDGAPLRWFSFDGGNFEIGHGGGDFCFDNETPRHQVYLNEFQLASRPVTNAEYMEFMSDNGYARPELWLSDGWDTVLAQRWEAPLYWENCDGSWLTYTLGGMHEVHPHEPVCHISYYEADAYARWAGARLPSEAEWELSASEVAVAGNFLDDGRFHPAAAKSGAARDVFQQLFGDVWEWTASPYMAYPGFHPAAGVLGEYNGKFMCNQMVLRGGSCVTPRSHIRATYRNFFPPQARWQFSGLRLAK